MKTEIDYLGDQIGWSVRRLLPPNRQLHKLDCAFMRILPPRVRNAVGYFRLVNNLAPSAPEPECLFDYSSRRLGQIYLDINPDGAPNTIYMPGISCPQVAHSSSFRPDHTSISVNWTHKIRWANIIQKKIDHGQPVSQTDQADAADLRDLQSILGKILTRTEFEYQDRGLPPADFVQVRKSIFPK